jgi:RimJ/RimL family protein N-acetyltransferase
MITGLFTNRLQLRAPGDSDAPAIARFLGDFAVAGNLARVPHPYGIADAEAWLARQCQKVSPSNACFAIDIAGAGLIGVVGFDYRHDGPHLGYWLGRPFWGRGLMSEAVRAGLDWYFANSGETTIRSGVFSFNAASRAIQRKLGFTELGRSRLMCLARKEELAHIDTQLTHDVWKAQQR